MPSRAAISAQLPVAPNWFTRACRLLSSSSVQLHSKYTVTTQCCGANLLLIYVRYGALVAGGGRADFRRTRGGYRVILVVRLRSRFGLKLPGWVGEGDELNVEGGNARLMRDDGGENGGRGWGGGEGRKGRGGVGPKVLSRG